VLLSWTAVAAILGAAWPGQTADPERADRLKAAILYNFTKFVTWPAECFDSEEAPLVIGVVGRGPFGRVAERSLKDKVARGRAVVVRHLETSEGQPPDPEQLRSYHIMFVNRSEEGWLEAILDSIAKMHVLSVSDITDFAVRGGMIELALEEDRYSIKINRRPAEVAKLKLSAKLLRLAMIVEPKQSADGTDNRP
jgi:hypothetical protein